LTGSCSKMPHLMSDRSRVVLGRLQFCTCRDPGLIISVEMVESSAGHRLGFWSAELELLV